MGRQIHQIGSSGLDKIPHPLWPMGAELIHHHYLIGLQLWHKEMLEIVLENLLVGRTLDGHRRSHSALQSDRRYEGGVFAPVTRYSAVGPLSYRSPGVAASHGGMKTTFVDEDQPTGVKAGGQPAPETTGFFVALGRYLRLFFMVQGPPLTWAMASPTVEVETAIPISSSKASR